MRDKPWQICFTAVSVTGIKTNNEAKPIRVLFILINIRIIQNFQFLKNIFYQTKFKFVFCFFNQVPVLSQS